MSKDTLDKLNESLKPILEMKLRLNKNLEPLRKMQAEINRSTIPLLEIQRKILKASAPLQNILKLQKDLYLKIHKPVFEEDLLCSDKELSEIVKSEAENFRKQAEEIKKLSLKDYADAVALFGIETESYEQITESYSSIKEMTTDEVKIVVQTIDSIYTKTLLTYDVLNELIRENPLLIILITALINFVKTKFQ